MGSKERVPADDPQLNLQFDAPVEKPPVAEKGPAEIVADDDATCGHPKGSNQCVVCRPRRKQ